MPAIMGYFGLLLTGCTVSTFGPPQSFNVTVDLKQLESHFTQASAITNYYANPSQEARNKVILGRIVMINLRYLEWVHTVTEDKQFLDTSTDILIMSLSLAGTATGGATAKTVLAAVSTGVSGGKVSIDKHYYYEKTVSALIATMNAQRKEILAHILEGMTLPLERYTFEQALSDTYEYYQAGTFMGAVRTIQSEAGSKEAKADLKIELLEAPTPGQLAAEASIGRLLAAFPTDQSQVDKIRAAIKKIWQDGESRFSSIHRRPMRGTPDDIKLLLRLFRQIVPDRSADLVDELKQQGLIRSNS